MTPVTTHISVLTEEVLRFLQPKTGGLYLDATFGGGGHTSAILEASSPEGKVIAIDRDQGVKEGAAKLAGEFPHRFSFQTLSYDHLSSLGKTFDGIVFDLGLSTDQLESTRGFSFSRNEPLDMRFDSHSGQNAAQFLNQASFNELVKAFRELAQDRYPAKLAKNVVERRKIEPFRTTADLVTAVGTANPKVLAPIFQAVRIVVNNEIETLKAGLEEARRSLKKRGVLVVISFHSGEDRIVKQFLRDSDLEVLTKKPVMASNTERQRNPRSRSAKLRAGLLKN